MVVEQQLPLGHISYQFTHQAGVPRRGLLAWLESDDPSNCLLFPIYVPFFVCHSFLGQIFMISLT